MKALAAILCLILAIAGCNKPVTKLESRLISPNQTELLKIDSIITDAIQQRAMPGCRLLAAQNGHIIINKCYGYIDYDSVTPVSMNTFYDFASITKIAAGAPCLMRMYQDGKIDLDKPLCEYFDLDSNGATLGDALAHQAGFKPWLNLRGQLATISYELLNSPNFNVENAQNQIRQTICNQPLNERGNYLYSDLGFYLYPALVKEYYNKDFEQFLIDEFYRPLGIKLCFNPLRYYPKEIIAPTENDTIWRKTIVQGTVHDEGAALMGGVSGHAGLFGRAQDLAVLMQMYLNKGSYNNVEYLKPETVDKFTTQAFPDNRRGLVFDKTPLDTAINGTPSKMASRLSFGHTGFTGSFTWADPENGLLIVFLCNSTFPCRSTLISKLDVRTKIHDQLYLLVKEKE